MKIIELHKPTPKCPRCKVHLIARITLTYDRVYDCPKCQAVYGEIQEEKK